MGEGAAGLGGTDRDLEQHIKGMEVAVVQDLRRLTLQQLTTQLGERAGE